RQFMMKDSYSFDLDPAGLDVSYQKHRTTYCRIFERCGLKYLVIEAHSGAMGGSQSEEFMVYTPAGEDYVVNCRNCHYAANLEKASSKIDPVADLVAEGDGQPLAVHTPGQKTIEEVARYLGVSPKNQIKTLALMMNSTGEKSSPAQSQAVAVLMRGDDQLNEAKLSSALGGKQARPMQDDEIQELFRSPAGFLGPLTIRWASGADDKTRPLLLVDQALQGRSNLITGANQADYHLKNVTPGRDFMPTAYCDLRTVTSGDPCSNCGQALEMATAVEVGHIFKLGYKYSQSMGARVLDKNGKEMTVIMGSYGIGMERILTAAVEQANDDHGFWLPPSIAPFEVIVTPTNMADPKLKSVAEHISERLEARGVDVLFDDRDERPGVKFKDADLVGIPFRINVGKKVTEDTVEVVQRSTGQSKDVTIPAIAEYFEQILGLGQKH
ncbi:MAG: proline--tRNA ligase, partial [Acidobacteria bacterium]|nr:proline--tRNA ligase [Acidobacteriota bacterium]